MLLRVSDCLAIAGKTKNVSLVTIVCITMLYLLLLPQGPQFRRFSDP